MLVYLVAAKTGNSWRRYSITTKVSPVHRNDHVKLYAIINKGWRKPPEAILMMNVDAGFD